MRRFSFIRLHRTVSLAVTPQLCLRRPILFCLARKEWGEKRRWIRIGLYRKPQNKPVEKHCSQHTEIFLQSYTTAPPAWNNAPIDDRCHAGRRQNTLPWNAERIYVCVDGTEYLRSIVQHAVQNRNKPSIPEMSRSEIDAVCPQMRVVHSSEPKAIGKVAALRPKRAFRPRSGQKLARVSAQYKPRPSASFCLLFLAQQKK